MKEQGGCQQWGASRGRYAQSGTNRRDLVLHVRHPFAHGCETPKERREDTKEGQFARSSASQTKQQRNERLEQRFSFPSERNCFRDSELGIDPLKSEVHVDERGIGSVGEEKV